MNEDEQQGLTLQRQVRLGHVFLAMAKDLDFIQNDLGSRWKFLSQEGASSDFCFKQLLWFLQSEIQAVRPQEWKQSQQPGGCCKDPGEGWWWLRSPAW